MPVGQPEFVENPENRCPVVLLVDSSSSMAGAPIQELNRGIGIFKEELMRDAQASLSIEVAVVSFGPVQLVQDFVTVDRLPPMTLEADGLTPIGEAVEYAIALLNQRKELYRESGIQYYRPWIFMITDGAPTDEWKRAAEMIRQGEDERKFSFFAVGVEGADFNTLKQITPPDRPPVRLNGLDFQSMFVWLSASMKRVSTSKVGQPLALPPVGWGQITT
ncbi:MAG: VWA domain-containing protein [Leptolyngbyaceae bacterium]|nr:VWA domain-containing protein [Leptolyngbyaceae bacterium]